MPAKSLTKNKRFTENPHGVIEKSPSSLGLSPTVLSKNESVYGRQIAFAAAFLLPASKLLEAPSILAQYAAGDLLLPAFFHFILQFLVLGVLLFVIYRSEIPLITRIQQSLGRFLPFFYILYAVYFLFSAILPLFDLEKFIYAAFFDTEPTAFFFAFFFFLSAFICTKGIKAIGRCADLCLFLFVFPFFALIIMSLSEADFSHLLPLFGTKFGHTMSAFTHTTPHFSDVILLLPLLCYYQPKKQDAPKILLGYGFGALCTLIFLAVFFATYSSFAAREHYAFSKIAQYFPALTVLGRIDLLFVYFLSVVLLFYTCLPLQYSTELFSRSVQKPHFRVWISLALNFALFLFLLFANKYYDSIYQFISAKIPFIFWLIADMVPLFLIFLPKSIDNSTLSKNKKTSQNKE